MSLFVICDTLVVLISSPPCVAPKPVTGRAASVGRSGRSLVAEKPRGRQLGSLLARPTPVISPDSTILRGPHGRVPDPNPHDAMAPAADPGRTRNGVTRVKEYEKTHTQIYCGSRRDVRLAGLMILSVGSQPGSSCSVTPCQTPAGLQLMAPQLSRQTTSQLQNDLIDGSVGAAALLYHIVGWPKATMAHAGRQAAGGRAPDLLPCPDRHTRQRGQD
ncbi:hypothetical protein GGR56DRAFT_278072 [Xylariaceae sp. FL0804]|nr:hypothetical protein GGR56DRAFT_278072 [Xylariaceae sp. FL0804]